MEGQMKRFAICMLSVLCIAAVGCSDDNGNDVGNDGGPEPTECDATAVRQVTGLSICAVKQEGHYYVTTLFPLTGSLGSFGATFEQAVFLALTEINDAGGIDGKCLGMLVCDTATDPTTAGEAMAEIGAASPVGAVIGPAASGSALVAYVEAAAAGKVMITPSGTSPVLTDLDDDGYLFRTAVSDAFQGKIASEIAQREGFDKVFVINRDDAYGNGLRGVFIAEFTASGGQADYVTYDEAAAGFERTVIDAAVAYAPDAVFLVSFVDDGAAILQTASIDGWTDPKWILPDGPKDAETILKVGSDAFLEGVLGTSPAAPTGADFNAFASAFEAAWGEPPTVFNANSYDAMYLVAIAMALSADPDVGSQIRDSLADTQAGTMIHPGEWDKVLENLAAGEMDYAGASGPLDFDANGDVLSNIEEWTITGGQIVTVGCWTPEGNACP
jgi:branched-chain amino acid transport system substrate-binding protein